MGKKTFFRTYGEEINSFFYLMIDNQSIICILLNFLAVEI